MTEDASPSAPPRIATAPTGRGPGHVPADALWGPQTELARRHFAIGDRTVPPELLHAIARIKAAAATVNRDLGRLDPAVAEAVAAAAQAVATGAHDDAFPLSPWQSGSMTQSHMNVNEVLATLASRRLGGRAVHPNDEVNLGQSSNDVVPSALHLAVLQALRQRLAPAVGGLIDALGEAAARVGATPKLGRTHLQDAVPLTAGDEVGAWRTEVLLARDAIDAATPGLHALAIGGTAVGSGLNTHPAFGDRVCEQLRATTGLPVRPAADRFAALAGHEPLLVLHGALKVLAVALVQVANDLRLLACGPRGGLAEYRLPANEPGSSIMPGKVNPTQCEMVVMVGGQVIGHDAAVTFGAAAGHLQLNTAKPLIAVNVLASIRLLSDACASFDAHAVRGLQADAARMDALLRGSLMLVTALTPHIGHDRAAAIAQRAHAAGTTLREAALAAGVDGTDFDRWTDPHRLARPP